MNEPVLDAPQQAMLDAAAGKSAGTLLREAREAAGLHVGALAVSLKVPVKKLEALEADDLEQLPDAVFARALAATVCRSLKVDPEPVLARLPQLHTPPLQVGSQETPVRLDSRGGGMRMPSIGGLPRSVVYLSALLVIGAIAVSLLPPKAAWRFAQLERFGFPILLLLLFTGILGKLLMPVMGVVMGMIYFIFNFSA